jgi:hypothetical protein
VIAPVGLITRFYERTAHSVGEIVARQKRLLVEVLKFSAELDLASICSRYRYFYSRRKH